MGSDRKLVVVASLRTDIYAARCVCRLRSVNAFSRPLPNIKPDGRLQPLRPDTRRTLQIRPTCAKRPHTLYAPECFAEAGMCVALSRVAMLLSELAIIYLAAAAPFGVARFLKDQTENARALRRLLKATAAALAWPLAAPRMLLKHSRAAGVEGDADDARAHTERRVELVKRSAVNSLREVEDLLLEVLRRRGDARGGAPRALRRARVRRALRGAFARVRCRRRRGSAYRARA